MNHVVRFAITIALLAMSAGCATTTTRLASVAPADVKLEETAQRELVLLEIARSQDRLDSLAFPLLIAARETCTRKSGPRLGLSFATVHDYKGLWVAPARSALGLSDTLTVVRVTAGSPAASSGVRKGDRIIAAGGAAIPTGRTATASLAKELSERDTLASTLVLLRGQDTVSVTISPVVLCNVGAIVTAEGDINAFADGKNIVVPWAMMRFAADEELRVVIAHEIAHNAMGHIEARKTNAAVGAIFGALVDIAAATQGVNTYGDNTANFMSAAAVAFSQDFEREADYVGLYIMARAGVSLEAAPNLWRQFAQINPSAIGYASTHPTTAERFVRLRNAIREIDTKRQNGSPLLPEMKRPAVPR